MLAILNIIPSVSPKNKTFFKEDQKRRKRIFGDEFLETFPKKPYCSNDLKSGLVVRPLEKAINHRYISFNPPSMVNWLVFDIDHPDGGFSWRDSPGIAPPNFAVINEKNGHSHLWYRLKSPVCRSNIARASPLKYLANIEYTYIKSIDGADPAFAGLVSKNPLWPENRLIFFREPGAGLSLSELCPDPLTPPAVEKAVGIGRNCELFDTARQWAYVAVREVRGVRDKSGFRNGLDLLLHRLNKEFKTPLPDNELRSIAKSIETFCLRHDHEAGERFRQRQRERGKRSGEVRRKGSVSEKKPWVEEGISRSLWYLRKSLRE